MQSYMCGYCKKMYSRKESLTKHLILCEFRHKTLAKTVVEQEEYGDMPTHDQLVRIVYEMHAKIQQLETRWTQMQPYLRHARRQERTDAIAWLNANKRVTLGYKEWINTCIHVKMAHYEDMIEESIFSVVHRIVEYNLNLMREQGTLIPVVSFHQLPGTLYMANKEEINEAKEAKETKEDQPRQPPLLVWRRMKSMDVARLFYKIQLKLLDLSAQWKRDHLREFNDTVSIQHGKTNSKILSFHFETGHPTLCRMKQGLYQQVKLNQRDVQVQLMDDMDES